MFGGPSSPFVVCAGQSLVRVKMRGQHPLGSKGWNIVSRKSRFGWVQTHISTFWIMDQSSPTSFAKRERNRSWSHIFPILDIWSLSGDIRDQSWVFCKITPNFACFGPEIFEERAPEFLDLHYKIGGDIDQVAKFHGDWPRELGDPVTN